MFQTPTFQFFFAPKTAEDESDREKRFLGGRQTQWDGSKGQTGFEDPGEIRGAPDRKT